MTTTHDSEHDELLRAVACGDIDASDVRFERQTASCGRCRDQVAALRDTQRQLDAAEQRERDRILREVELRPVSRMRPLVADFVRAQLAATDTSTLPKADVALGAERALPAVSERPAAEPRSAPIPVAVPMRPVLSRDETPATRRPARLRTWIALAAAAVVVFAWLTKFLRQDEAAASRSPLLGGTSKKELHPDGPVRGDYEPLTWSSLSTEPGEMFRVIVWDDTDAASPTPLLDKLTDEKEWFGETKHWPDRIRWEVHVGEPGASSERLKKRAKAHRAAADSSSR